MLKEYVHTILCCSALCGIVTVICPEGENGGLKKAVGFVMALLMLACVAKPALELVKGLDDGEYKSAFDTSGFEDEYKAVWQNTYSDIAEKDTSEYIKKYLLDKLSVSAEGFDVKCEVIFEGDTASLSCLEVRLYEMLNPRYVEALINEEFGCDCIVYEEWG